MRNIIFGDLSFLAAIIIFVLLVYFLYRFIGYLRARLFPVPDKNHPKQAVISIAGGLIITLDRVWFKGKWRYFLRGDLPYRFSSPEKDGLEKSIKAKK
ncbi:MAG TPA: hypothetical protein P5089_02860 [Candidatus Portnoybacteria bacterium]|nr:hypothetical protein [Candidatus Portnoybacteria bacterium]